jgi:hypothetical protein
MKKTLIDTCIRHMLTVVTKQKDKRFQKISYDGQLFLDMYEYVIWIITVPLKWNIQIEIHSIRYIIK